MTSQSFRRLNYFNGLFTEAEDWIAEQTYHREKHKLHNRTLHTPGLVPDRENKLAAVIAENGSVTIGPGCAIDNEGNELRLTETTLVPGSVASFGAGTVYVLLEYNEEKEGQRADPLNPGHSESPYLCEKPDLQLSAHPPRGRQVE